MTPGEFITEGDAIELNVGRRTVTLEVANTGDRPIQVGSHYHFAETNSALMFDRQAASGMRLNIASGTAVRFEPGQMRMVRLVALQGTDNIAGMSQVNIWGFRGLFNRTL
jgi:urease subunit beta